jgi:hypothetical protein
MKLNRSLTALALAGVLVLSGCGDDDKDNGDAKVGESASTSASESPSESATDEPTDEATDTAEGEEVDKDDFLADMREGVEGFTTAHVTMQVASSGGDMNGEGDMSLAGDKLAMAMTMEMPALGGEAEIRLVEGFMYMKIPGQSGGKFYKLDLSDPSGPLGSLGGLTDAFDPSKSFDTFAEGLTEVTYLGEDDLDGEDLDHYQLTIDTSKVEAFKDLPGASSLPKRVTYEMWVDDDFRMRGMDMELPTGKTVVRYTDLGDPVEIEAPPASQVATMPGM